jgi:ATP-dependent protease ClpP protease subunit
LTFVDPAAGGEQYLALAAPSLEALRVFWAWIGDNDQFTRERSMPTTYINFHATINMATVQNVIAAVSQKLMSGTNEFYFLLSTPGGQVMSGLTLYNFLRGIPATVKMHNVGNVDSIGNAIFVAADLPNRFACAHSTFMFHGVGVDIQNARFEEKNAREVVHSILADQKRIADILVARTNLSANQARKLFREARTKDATNAVAIGMAANIVDVQIPAGADIVSLVL